MLQQSTVLYCAVLALLELASLVLIMVRCRRAALLPMVPCAIILENTALSFNA